MSKQATIKTQISNAAQAIESHEWDEARDIVEALLARKLSNAQREAVEAMATAIEEARPAYNMSKHIAKYRARYQRSVAASGAKSLNNGDDLAQFLEMKTAAEVCALADRFCPIKSGETHMQRYERLNEGQKRMNSGNKLRAALRNGLIEVNEDGIQAI